MRLIKKKVEFYIVQAKLAWGIHEWDITWYPIKLGYGGCIEIQFTNKEAKMGLDAKVIKDEQELARTIHHEVGHCLFMGIERGIDDFVEYYITDKKAKATFWEQMNTRENEVLDHIVTKVFGV